MQMAAHMQQISARLALVNESMMEISQMLHCVEARLANELAQRENGLNRFVTRGVAAVPAICP
jgi:hypothetical protein